MNRKQRVITSIFLSLTAVILVLDHLFPGAAGVSYFKFATVAGIFWASLASLISGGRRREQFLLGWAVYLVMVGDFFLNLCSTVPDLPGKVMPLGVLAFLLAYLLVAAVFFKNCNLRFADLPAAALVLAIFIPNFAALSPWINGILLPGVFLFGLVITFMAWACLRSLFTCPYQPRVCLRAALAGLLILISDTALAHSLFNPSFAGHFVPWLKNIIWGAYLPAWTLMALNIAEDRFY